LDDELAELEQEQLDDKMLQTGAVPVSDEVHRLPAVGNGERKSSKPIKLCDILLT
jgi:charged multivesicular body protein 4